YLSAEIVTVRLPQRDVEQHHVRPKLVQLRHCLLRTLREHRLKLVGRKGDAQHLAHGLAIFDCQKLLGQSCSSFASLLQTAEAERYLHSLDWEAQANLIELHVSSQDYSETFAVARPRVTSSASQGSRPALRTFRQESGPRGTL